MIIDITRPIHSGMAIYPDNPTVRIETLRDAQGGKSALSEIALGSHTGTHIDAMLHILPGGTGPEAYGLDQLIGRAQVVEFPDATSTISAQDLLATSCERLLIKTRNSNTDVDVFDSEFVALDESAAKELVRRGIRLVGIDGPSIKKKGVSDRVHEILLQANVAIIEGLYLKEVKSGTYTLICLPLPISHIDGVPVRAVLDLAGEIDY